MIAPRRPGPEPTAGAGTTYSADAGGAAPRDAGPTVAGLAREVRFRLEVARGLGWSVPLGAAARAAPSPVTAAVPSSAAAPAALGAARPAAGGPPAAGTAAGTVRVAAGRRDTAPGGDEPGERARRQALLDAIDRDVRDCRECALCLGRTQTVFGVGDPCARLLFVGEGPGFDEDRLGEPFVGKAGKLLDRMIAAMGLTRSQVYIANIVKCRPPGNRTPEAAEALSCLGYLRRQIAVIRPEVICTLGNTPTRALLGVSTSITRARGKLVEYEGVPALPTFHPAYLLRNPAHKRLAWEDLQQIMGLLGLPAPGSRR